mgnify:FL=1
MSVHQDGSLVKMDFVFLSVTIALSSMVMAHVKCAISAIPCNKVNARYRIFFVKKEQMELVFLAIVGTFCTDRNVCLLPNWQI